MTGKKWWEKLAKRENRNDRRPPKNNWNSERHVNGDLANKISKTLLISAVWILHRLGRVPMATVILLLLFSVHFHWQQKRPADAIVEIYASVNPFGIDKRRHKIRFINDSSFPHR